MRLADCAPDLAERHPQHAGLELAGITADSRKVAPGMVFAALAGARVDGRAFVPDALKAGAAAVLTGEAGNVEAPVVLRAEDPRRALALMAAAFAGPQPGTIVAVTGTAGKTSVAEFTRQIFAAAGHQAVSLGTLGVAGAVSVPGGLTTPDPVALAGRLADLAGAGVTHVALEASSHGLDQRRLDGVRLTAAAFTNIGRDHMDYHASEADYLAAKLRLFDTLLPDGAPAVMNPDAPGGAAARDAAATPRTVGRQGDLIRLFDATPCPGGSMLALSIGTTHTVRLPLVGAFQVSNALIAAGLALVAGVEEMVVVDALRRLAGAPGRLELCGDKDGAPVFVDYAHKPDAVRAVLAAVRPSVPGRLMVVLGAGGDRDPGKRPLMGAAAAEGADIVIITDDNPRSEPPDAIRAAILSAAPGALEIPDRAEAIAHAVRLLAPGDALVVAGKGHETGQIVGDTVHPFDDRAVVRQALSGAGAGADAADADGEVAG